MYAGKLEKSDVVKYLGGPADAIRFIMRVLGGEAAVVKSELSNSRQLQDNPLKLAALRLDELDSMPKLGSLQVVSKGKKNVDYYLQKELVERQPEDIRAELRQLQDLESRCRRIGMMLGQYHLPSAARKGVLQEKLKRLQDEAEERLFNQQIDDIVEQSHSRQYDSGLGGLPSIGQAHRSGGGMGVHMSGAGSNRAAGSGRGRAV